MSHAAVVSPHGKPSVPSLWSRAKSLYAAFSARFAPASLVRRGPLTRPQRAEFENLLAPIENIVRHIIIAEAIRYLLMTPAGRKLLRETLKITAPPPKRANPFQPAVNVEAASADLPPPPQAGEVDAEGGRRGEARRQGRETHSVSSAERASPTATGRAAPGPAKPLINREDPATFACAFRVWRWTYDEPEPGDGDDGGDDAPKPKPQARAARLPKREWGLIDAADLDPAHAHAQPPDEPCTPLARRAEALRRILENPEAAILRTAKHLASLPGGFLHLTDPFIWRREWLTTPAWPDVIAAYKICAGAVRMLDLSG